MADSGVLEIKEGTEPATGATGYHRLFVDSADGAVKHKDDLGNVSNLDLAATAVTPGSYGSTSQVGTFTVNAYGQLTAASNASITPGSIGAQGLDSTLTSLAAFNTNGLIAQTAPDTFAGRTLTPGSASISISNGDGVSGNPTIDLPNTAVSAGSYGSSSQVGTFTVDAKGVLTAAANATITTGSIGAQPLDSTLTSLAAYNTNGILVQTAADTFTGRTIVSGHAGVSITNGDGVSGQPSISLNETSINHNNLSNFVANKHIDHSGVSITAGTGLSGGGDITVSRTLNIANTAVTAGTYYRPREVTVNAQGQLTDIKSYDLDYDAILFDDFINNTSAGALNWTTANSGSGASSSTTTMTVDATYKAMGVLQLTTGTTAAGRATIHLGLADMVSGFATIECIVKATIATLSNGTERFQCALGLGDDTGATLAAQQTDGIYFRYDDTVSANWLIETSQASTRTTSDSGVAVSNVAYQELKFIVNSAGSSVTFYINGSSVGTITTNIPGDAQYYAPILKIMKSVGTTSRQVHVDYYFLKTSWPTAR